MKSIKNLELFHIHDHTLNKHSNLWEVGNCFEINNDFKSMFGQEIEGFDEIVGEYSTDPIFKREMALEVIRKEKYPKIISRFHCIWLSDKQALNYWVGQLPGKVYRVSATGIIFESSDNFLCGEEDREYKDIKKDCYKYWEAPFATEMDYYKKEILFQGKIKVLERND